MTRAPVALIAMSGAIVRDSFCGAASRLLHLRAAKRGVIK
jgi:hypothetical protein